MNPEPLTKRRIIREGTQIIDPAFPYTHTATNDLAYYKEKDVRSAVEWLKLPHLVFSKSGGFPCRICNRKVYIHTHENADEGRCWNCLIDEAFPAVTKKEEVRD